MFSQPRAKREATATYRTDLIAWFIGRRMLEKLELAPAKALAAVPCGLLQWPTQVGESGRTAVDPSRLVEHIDSRTRRKVAGRVCITVHGLRSGHLPAGFGLEYA